MGIWVVSRVVFIFYGGSWRKSETLITFYEKGEMTRAHIRISPMGNESLAEVENCSVVLAQLLSQDLWHLPLADVHVQRRQRVGLPRAGFCHV